MTGLRPGLALDLWEGEELRSAFYLGEEKGKLKVVTSAGKELKVPESRVANPGEVLADPHLAAKLGAGARERVQAFAAPALIGELVRQYRALAGRTR